MKKTILLFLMGLLTLGVQAQSVGSQTVLDQRDNYVLTITGGNYQIIAKDYFGGKDVIIDLGNDQTLALAKLMTLQSNLKQTKKGIPTVETFGYRTYNFVNAGNTYLISEGNADYCMSAYTLLVPGLKKHSDFLKNVLRMPNSIGHLTNSDLSRLQKKILK